MQNGNIIDEILEKFGENIPIDFFVIEWENRAEQKYPFVTKDGVPYFPFIKFPKLDYIGRNKFIKDFKKASKSSVERAAIEIEEDLAKKIDDEFFKYFPQCRVDNGVSDTTVVGTYTEGKPITLTNKNIQKYLEEGKKMLSRARQYEFNEARAAFNHNPFKANPFYSYGIQEMKERINKHLIITNQRDTYGDVFTMNGKIIPNEKLLRVNSNNYIPTFNPPKQMTTDKYELLHHMPRHKKGEIKTFQEWIDETRLLPNVYPHWFKKVVEFKKEIDSLIYHKACEVKNYDENERLIPLSEQIKIDQDRTFAIKETFEKEEHSNAELALKQHIHKFPEPEVGDDFYWFNSDGEFEITSYPKYSTEVLRSDYKNGTIMNKDVKKKHLRKREYLIKQSNKYI